MRIRRRPLLLSLSSYYSSPSSSSLSSDPCLQQPAAKEESVADGEGSGKEVAGSATKLGRLHPDGDLPLVQDLLPNYKSNPDDEAAIREEKIQELDDPSSQKTLSGWCNGESATMRRGGGGGIGNGVIGNCSSDGVVVVIKREEEKGKKRKSPPVLMEGSRCSRVNGRGWRCSQQTLVGYSLCEHHLGKGRIRSMNTTAIRGGRSRSTTSVTRKHNKACSSDRDDNVGGSGVASSVAKQDVDDNIGEKKGNKNKKKIGLVRARSISSLLDETDHLAAATLSSLAAATLNI